MLIFNKAEKELFKTLQKYFEPIYDWDFKTQAYAASVYTIDNTYLPCVLFRSCSEQVDNALSELDEIKKSKNSDDRIDFRTIVKGYVAANNLIQSDMIAKVEKSPFALSTRCVKKLATLLAQEGGGVSFKGTMDDGQKFDFFTDYDIGFFEMPEGYNGSRMVDVIPHDRRSDFNDLKGKPFFSCFLDWIPPVFNNKFH